MYMKYMSHFGTSYLKIMGYDNRRGFMQCNKYLMCYILLFYSKCVR